MTQSIATQSTRPPPRVELHPKSRVPRAGDACDGCGSIATVRVPLVAANGLARAWMTLCAACKASEDQSYVAEMSINQRGWVRG